jgi:catechol 2,3-dioxygenase-like lactoylglutathione lyase family enzyme
MFVEDLELSVTFYRELLGMEVSIKSTSAALLVSADGFQLYLREMAQNAQHAVGSIGVQYVIWTAAGDEDLRRCERFLKGRSAHVHTRAADGFTLVEGRDPSGAPFVMTYPGPDQAVRHEIMSRIYVW